MLEAVIFDFDGVILDTSDQLYQGYNKLLAQSGIEYMEHQFNDNYGLKTKEHFKKVYLENAIQLSDSELNEIVIKRDEYYQQLCSGDLQALPGTEKLLKELKLNSEHLKVGVATSTSRDNLDHFLNQLKLNNYFDHTIAGTEVSKGKPDPEIYLEMCSVLDVDPIKCVGIEDTDKGILALKNANMKAIGVTFTNRKEYDFSNADLLVVTLEELNLMKINKLISDPTDNL